MASSIDASRIKTFHPHGSSKKDREHKLHRVEVKANFQYAKVEIEALQELTGLTPRYKNYTRQRRERGDYYGDTSIPHAGGDEPKAACFHISSQSSVVYSICVAPT